MRVLVTAPYVGEIGWELMSWQARVRWCFGQSKFDRLVVIGGAGKSAFYDDMPLDYHEVDLSALPGRASEDRRVADPSGTLVPAEAIRAAVLLMVEPLVARLRNR